MFSNGCLPRQQTNPRGRRFCRRQPILLILAGTLFAATPLWAVVAFPIHWHWSNPTPHGNDIVDLAYHNGVYVEIGDRGQLYTSEDLTLWTPRDTQVVNTLQAATYFGDRLIVTGNNGLVLYADSLDSFQPVDLGTTNWIEGVAASTNLAVVVGDNAAIYTSADGATWQPQPQSFTTWLRSVAYGSGQFVTVGESGFIASSPDGTNWRVRASGVTNDLNKVAWITNQFWVAGDAGVVLVSSDGSQWTPVSGSGATNALYGADGYSGSTLVAGNLEGHRHANQTWTNELDPSQTATPAPSWTYYSALWDGSRYFLGGLDGMFVQGTQTNNLVAWQTSADPIRNWLWDVARTPDFYVAVGDHATVMTSENGLDWNLELVPDAATNAIFLGVGGTTNLLVAVGNAGTILFSPDQQRTVVITNADGTMTTNSASTLGIIWYPAAPDLNTNNDLQGVAALGNLIVVTGGNETILTSTNGSNWTQHVVASGSGPFLSSVTAFPGGLLAVGGQGTVLTSTNGTDWTTVQPGVITTNWIYRVRYLGGQLIAVGQNGLILTSADGAKWAAQPSGTTHWLNDVAYVDNTYFIVGNQGTVLASTNATVWTNVGTITGKSLYGLAANNGQLIAAGIAGIILRSQIIPALTPVNVLRFSRATGQNLFLFAGQPDQRFSLDSSLDLTNWFTGPVLEFYDSTGTLLYLQDSNSVAGAFYRTTLSP